VIFLGLCCHNPNSPLLDSKQKPPNFILTEPVEPFSRENVPIKPVLSAFFQNELGMFIAFFLVNLLSAREYFIEGRGKKDDKMK
jgi:hypothetical protein